MRSAELSIIRIACLAVIVPCLVSSTPAQTTLAQASDFVNSIGVNIHSENTNTAYGNTCLVLSEMQKLGIKHVREGSQLAQSTASNSATCTNATPYDMLRILGNTGIRYVLNVSLKAGAAAAAPPYSSNYFQTAVSNLTFNGVPYVEAFEGFNELDYADPNNWVHDWNPYFAGLQSANSTGIPLWGSPLAYVCNASQLSPVQSTVGTFHPYPGGNNPSYPFTGQICGGSLTEQDQLRALFPSAPYLVATENGYYNSVNCTPTAQTPCGAPIDDYTGGKYVPRLLLESFRAGVARTYIYELLDEKVESDPNPSNTLYDNNYNCMQCNFGLVQVDDSGNASEKPAFTAVANLISILNKGIASAPLGSLNYTLTAPSTVRSLLLQKSPAVFDLILWQDVSSWNTSNNTEYTVSPQAVTLAVNSTSVSTYTPRISATPTAVTAQPGYTFNLSVPDEALIVEIQAGAPEAGGNLTIGGNYGHN